MLEWRGLEMAQMSIWIYGCQARWVTFRPTFNNATNVANVTKRHILRDIYAPLVRAETLRALLLLAQCYIVITVGAETRFQR